MNTTGTASCQQGRGWSRLKPISVDYLESIGLPSKGDNRLLDFKTQKTYFSKVVERYEQVRSQSGLDNGLNDAFSSFSLDGKSSGDSEAAESIANGLNNCKSEDRPLKSAISEMSTILMAMRKLREAIVASARSDTFALNVYVFIIRSTILMGHMESYHPALLHLFYKIHPIVPLAESVHHEFLGYYILDLACRQNDLAGAYHVKCCYNCRDANTEAILKALMHGNWYKFWLLEGVVESRQRRLMQWAEPGMRSHALNCLGRSYLSVDKNYLEKAVSHRWEELGEKESLGWQLDGDIVTIRRISRK